MKHFIYSLIGFAAALAVVSGCQKETRVARDGDTVDATFTIDLGTGTRAAYSDGTSATTLNVLVYGLQGDGTTYKYLSGISKTGDGAITDAFDASLKASVTIRLVKGVNYDVVFWAQNPAGPYTLDAANGTMTVNSAGNANLEARDAFFAKVSTGLIDGSTTTFSAQLKHPFAQINVFTTADDWKAAQDNEIVFAGSSMNVIKAPNVLDLRTGAVSGEVEYAFAAAAVNTDDTYAVTAPNNYKYIAMNYVLAGESSATAQVKFGVYRDDLTNLLTDYDLANVPYRRNWRTNITGNIFSVDGTFNIEIVPAYDGENVFPIDGEPQTITVPATGFAPASATGYSFDTDTNTGAVTVEQGSTLDFSGITSNSGFDPKYSSSNKTVGTITDAGVFTALSAGTTDVTIHFNSVQGGVEGTKAADDNFASADVVFTVTVPEVELEQVAAPVFSVAAGEVEADTEVTLSCTTEGAKIYYSLTDAAPATEYTAAIKITEAVTIKAIAKKEGMADSEVATAAYTVKAVVDNHGKVADDPFNIAEAIAYIDAMEDPATASTEDVFVKGVVNQIVYTFNTEHGTATFWIADTYASTDRFEAYGVYPIASGTSWTESDPQIQLNDEVVICGKVLKYKTTYETSSKNAYIHTWNHAVATPTFSVASGTVESGTEVTLSCATEGAKIYYSTTDADPTTEYTAAIKITEDVTIKAVAKKDGLRDSGVVSAVYAVKTGEEETFDVETVTNNTLTWAAETDATYGDGFSVTTTEGVKIGFYKGSGTTALVTPDATSMRVYKNSVLVVTPASGKKISKVVLTVDAAKYAVAMTADGMTVLPDTTALTISLSSSTSVDSLIATASSAQVRVNKIQIKYAE